MNHSNQKPGYYHLMMKLLDFKILFFFLFNIYSFSQNIVSGTVISSTGTKLSLVEIYNKTNGTKYLTDTSGEFSIEFENANSSDFVIYKQNYSVLEIKISAPETNRIIILDKLNNLSEIVIKIKKKKYLHSIN